MMSLPLLALFFTGVIQRITIYVRTRTTIPADYLMITALIMFFGYLFVGNLSHSFPKYHYPFVALCCVCTALWLEPLLTSVSVSRILSALALSAGLAGLYYVLCGDLLFTTDYLVRQTMIEQPAALPALLTTIAKKLCWYTLIPIILYAAWHTLWGRTAPYPTWIGAALVCAIGATLATNVLQFQAPYGTVYCYGNTAPLELRTFLQNEKAQGHIILATGETHYLIGSKVRTQQRIWDNPEVFLRTLKEGPVDCVVWGIATNTVDQYHRVFADPAVRTYLQTYYEQKHFDAYTVQRRIAHMNGATLVNS
jgi:hypothetical protein